MDREGQKQMNRSQVDGQRDAGGQRDTDRQSQTEESSRCPHDRSCSHVAQMRISVNQCKGGHVPVPSTSRMTWGRG